MLKLMTASKKKIHVGATSIKKAAQAFLVTLSLAAPSFAATVDISGGHELCDAAQEVCFRGSITWNKNDRLIEISGQLVAPAPAAGTMTFNFHGETGAGEPVIHATDIKLRAVGREILDKKIIPPYSSETRWQLTSIRFRADEE